MTRGRCNNNSICTRRWATSLESCPTVVAFMCGHALTARWVLLHSWVSRRGYTRTYLLKAFAVNLHVRFVNVF
jgi:hypothetical protein